MLRAEFSDAIPSESPASLIHHPIDLTSDPNLVMSIPTVWSGEVRPDYRIRGLQGRDVRLGSGVEVRPTHDTDLTPVIARDGAF